MSKDVFNHVLQPSFIFCYLAVFGCFFCFVSFRLVMTHHGFMKRNRLCSQLYIYLYGVIGHLSICLLFVLVLLTVCIAVPAIMLIVA